MERIDPWGQKYNVAVLTESWSPASDRIHDVPHEKYEQWLVDNPLVVDVKAGHRRYGCQGQTVFAIDLPTGDCAAAVSRRTTLPGTPLSMLAANGTSL